MNNLYQTWVTGGSGYAVLQDKQIVENRRFNNDSVIKDDEIIEDIKPDGVYAVSATGELIDYNLANETALGVALVAGEHKFVIAKTDAASGTNTNLYWAKNFNGTEVDGIINTEGEGGIGEGKTYGTDFTTWSSGPVSDFNGKSNTAALIADYTKHGVYMDTRDMCYVLNTFNQAEQAAGRSAKWYIPACGQLALMYLNMTEINAALEKIGGDVIARTYWSSSECAVIYGWSVAFRSGDVYETSKTYTTAVRFVRDLQ